MDFRNFLLRALPRDDRAVFEPHLNETTLAPGQLLIKAATKVETVFFPEQACVSIVAAMADGSSVETCSIGRESAPALLDLLADQPSRSRVFAQIGGQAATLPAAVFRRQLAESPALRDLVMLHVRAAAVQADQGVACNATHDVQSRLARWLLMTQDRVGSSSLALTQEYMAVMTGVQRTTISVAAASLKRSRIIGYSRGNVVVLDRPALMDCACECYGVIHEQFTALAELAGSRSQEATEARLIRV